MAGEQITREQYERVRARCKADPWNLMELLTRGNRAVERFHRPLLNLMTRRGREFVQMMDDPRYESALMRSVRSWCRERDIDLSTEAGRSRLVWIITFSGVNIRISRSMGKTFTGRVAMIWLAINDPDIDIGICSKSTPATERIIEAISISTKGEEFQNFFPEYVRKDVPLRESMNAGVVDLAGRTRAEQSTIEGRGLLGNWTGPHYGVIWADDIIGTESGDASMDDAIRWLAALGGISKSSVLGGTWRLFTGTRYDDLDDHGAVHINDDTLLSVVVPIWEKPEYTLDNLMRDGEPTLPEWYPVDEIRKMRTRTLAGPGGVMSWLNNFELTTLSAGDRRIPVEILTRQTLVMDSDDLGREILVRPDSHGRPVRVAVAELDRSAGIDQAFSEAKHADLWVFIHAGQDAEGHRYLLDGVSGKGYETLLSSIIPAWTRWRRPTEIGIDTTGMQTITTDLMKREPAFQQLLPCLRPVTAANISKAIRITAYVVAGLKSGILWIHPRLADFIRQAQRWNPDSARAKQAGTDDWLDAASIALEVLRSIPVSPEDVARSEFQAYAAREKDAGAGLVESVSGGDDWFAVLFDGEGFD